MKETSIVRTLDKSTEGYKRQVVMSSRKLPGWNSRNIRKYVPTAWFSKRYFEWRVLSPCGRIFPHLWCVSQQSLLVFSKASVCGCVCACRSFAAYSVWHVVQGTIARDGLRLAQDCLVTDAPAALYLWVKPISL